MTDSMQTVQGRCPACGASSLFLGDGGHVTCSRRECPNPTLADEMLHGESSAEAALDAAYRERAHLVAHLAALHPSHIGRTDPSAPDWPVLIIETPAGQMSWHFAERDLDLVTHVQPTSPEHREWDGHSTEEKYQRLLTLTTISAVKKSLPAVRDAEAERLDWLQTELAAERRRNLVANSRNADQTAALAEARTTNQRLNRRTQELESELAAYRRAVAEWQINEQNAYIPLRTIAAIAKAAGLDIPTDRFEMHYQRLERAEAAVARVREYVATSDDDGIRTRENILRIVGDWPGPEAGHRYLSTGCFHGDHDYCKAMTGLNGAKRPAECKKCGAKCICPCHQEQPDA